MPALRAIEQHFSGRPAFLLDGVEHCSEGRRALPAFGDIVEAHDREILRYAQTASLRLGHDGEGLDIGHCEHRLQVRLGVQESRDPFGRCSRHIGPGLDDWDLSGLETDGLQGVEVSGEAVSIEGETA